MKKNSNTFFEAAVSEKDGELLVDMESSKSLLHNQQAICYIISAHINQTLKELEISDPASAGETVGAMLIGIHRTSFMTAIESILDKMPEAADKQKFARSLATTLALGNNAMTEAVKYVREHADPMQ